MVQGCAQMASDVMKICDLSLSHLGVSVWLFRRLDWASIYMDI